MFMFYRVSRDVMRVAGRSGGGGAAPSPKLSPGLTLFIRFVAITAFAVAGTVILVGGFGRHPGPDSPGAVVVRSLPDCMPGTSHMGAAGGGPEDSYAVFAGGCELNDGTLVRVVAWQPGDTANQQEYIAGWTPGNGTPGRGEAVMCCVVSPAGVGPWAVSLQSGPNQAPAKDWAAVAQAAHGEMQTRAVLH